MIASAMLSLNTENANAQDYEDWIDDDTYYTKELPGLTYERVHIVYRKPLGDFYQSEVDVANFKIVYKQIDMTEKANEHFYYPTEPQDGRMSLIDILLDGIHKGLITAFAERDNKEFGAKITEKEIKMPEKSSEVKSYLLKEVWYYDKYQSRKAKKIIGICPIHTYYKESDVNKEFPQQEKLFWIYYPESRKLLSYNECINMNGDADRYNYEDVFEKRMFSSSVIKESDMYDYQSIQEKLALPQDIIDPRTPEERKKDSNDSLYFAQLNPKFKKIAEFLKNSKGRVTLEFTPEEIFALEKDAPRYGYHKDIVDDSYNLGELFRRIPNLMVDLVIKENENLKIEYRDDMVPFENSIDGFKDCYALRSITLPKTAYCILDSAFMRCKYLETVNIQNGLYKIGDKAFKGCFNLEHIEIPKSVKEIGVNPFYRCASLIDHKNTDVIKVSGKKYEIVDPEDLEKTILYRSPLIEYIFNYKNGHLEYREYLLNESNYEDTDEGFYRDGGLSRSIKELKRAIWEGEDD